MELKQHPLSAAFPAMSADDFQALKDNIEVNGQREPVTIHEGMVLDGWHRYRACIELGLKPLQFTFKEGDDPSAFVESANLHRRHLTASQRAAAVVAVRAWAPAHRPEANKGAAAAPLSTNKEMAAAAKVSVRTIKDAKAAHGAGLSEPVIAGAITVEEAARIARGTGSPAPPAAPAPAPAPAEAFGPSAEEIAEAEREQEAEFAAFRLVLESDDKMAAAVAEVKRLTALVRVLEERNNGLMNERNAALQAAKSWQRKAEKFERALKAAA